MRVPEKYRPNVAIVVVNNHGEILACQRVDIEGAWQLPQGGVEEGEAVEEAMYRELAEEIGTNDVSIIGQLPKVLRYEWPEHLYPRGYRGQEQTYFLVRLNAGATINLKTKKPEFDQVEWLSIHKFLKRVSGFKQEAYRTALEQFQKLYPQIFRE